MKRAINKYLSKIGYKISKVDSLNNRISNGDYKWLQEFGINTIIDIGANDGGFALTINMILPHAFIHSFEPIEKCFIDLQENTRSIKNIKLYKYALGENEEIKEFHINNFSASSSFLELNNQHIKSFPFTASTNSQLIQIKKLDSFIDSINPKSKVLLKLDVQGYELSVLRGAEGILNSTDMIIAEVSFVELYKNQPLFHEVYEYLFNHDFIYYGHFDELKDPLTKCTLQEDAIFIRR